MVSKILLKYKNLPIQARASFWFLICAFLQKGISFITTPIFTRILTTAEYGQFNVYNSWFNMLLSIVSLNLFYGVYTRGLVKYKDERDVFSSSLQGLTFSLIIIWLVIYLAFRKFWNTVLGLPTFHVLLMFFSIWMTSVFCFWSIDQRVDFKYRKLVAVTIGVAVLKPTLSIAMILFCDDNVTARIVSIVFVEFIAYFGLFISQMKKGRQFFNAKFWKHALMFNIPLIPHYLSTSILNSADRIMIKDMVGESAAGIYSLAYSIAMIMMMLNTSLLQTLEPWLYKKINEKKIEDIGKVAYPAFIIVAIANILLIALAPELVAIFAPKEYYSAIYVIPPIAMSVFYMFAYTFFAVFEFYYKKTTLIVVATSAGAILNIILNKIFIGIFGYIAAGYTTLACYMIYAIFHFVFMWKTCKNNLNNAQPYSPKIFLIISVLFLGAGFFFLFIYNFTILRYCLLVLSVLISFIERKRIINVVTNILSIRKP